MSRDEMEMQAGMATRDLMNAIVTLAELPVDIVKLEYIDLELAEGRLSQILEKVYDRDCVRRLRQRAYGYKETASGPVAMREVSTIGEHERSSS